MKNYSLKAIRLLAVLLVGGGIILLAREGFSFKDASAIGDSKTELAPRTDSEQQIIDAYKRSNKAVVYVSTRAQVQDFYGVAQQEGSGSGFIVDKARALVVSNYHVISGAEQIAVTLGSGESYLAKVVGSDPDNDIALLKIVDPPEDIAQLELGDSSSLEVGQRVLAIGNPFGLERTLTSGIISSLGRQIRAESGLLIEDIIQTDAPINPGNSGGPLLDTAGRVVGMNTAIVSQSGGSNGIGFAVPVNQIKNALPQLEQYGRVLRPKIGAKIVDTEAGPMVLEVVAGGPFDQAGIEGAWREWSNGLFRGYRVDSSRADFIVGINGKPTPDKSALLNEIAKSPKDQALSLEVRRGLSARRTRSVKVKPVLG